MDFCLSRVVRHDPNGGVADTHDEAKTAFRAAWSVRYRQKRT